MIAADFYEGAFGPSILVEASSPEGIEWLRSVLFDLIVGGSGAAVRLDQAPGVTLTSAITVLELSTVSTATWKCLRRDGTEFSWRGTVEEWTDARDLLAPLLDGHGHQYLTDEGRDDALVEVSVGEGHGLIAES